MVCLHVNFLSPVFLFVLSTVEMTLWSRQMLSREIEHWLVANRPVTRWGEASPRKIVRSPWKNVLVQFSSTHSQWPSGAL